MKTMMKNSLIVFALEDESQNRFDDYNCLYAGVGKINAAYSLMRYLSRNGSPDLIINLGTAGSSAHATGSIVHCTRFIQRDIDATALSFKRFETPFPNTPIILEPEGPETTFPKGTCGTGDCFKTALKEHAYDVMDMEAYAVAFIAYTQRVPFLCLKFISDGADEGAALEWRQALETGSRLLLQATESLAAER